MALTEEQKNKIRGELRTVITPTDQPVDRKSYIKSIVSNTSVDPTEPKGFVADIKNIGTDIKDSFSNKSENIREIQESYESGKTGLLRGAFQKFGQVAGGVSDVIGSTIMGGVKAATPQPIQEAVGDTVQAGVEKIAQTDTAQRLIQGYQNLTPERQKDIESILGITSLTTDVAGGVLLKKPVTQAVKKTIDIGVDTFKATGKAFEGAVDMARPTIKNVTAIPNRIGTNIADKQATEQAIQSLPSKVAQNSAREGIDVQDITQLYEVPVEQKKGLRKLYETVIEYVDNNKGKNPIEVVGAPIVKRIKQLNEQVKKLGTDLDNEAGSLKFQTVKDLEALNTKIDTTLQSQGITFANGKLNLKGSQLEGLGGNEGIIQNVYKRFVNTKDANDLHRLKKYIDDNVEFGKTSQGLTGNAERLLKDWRRSIDTTLDDQFPTYKKINDDYAKRIKPIKDIQKLMKNITGADEDLLNMSAGLLARRIASNATSNPQIRQILRNLDKATKVKGKVSLNVENLVDFYAVLERYFPEITGSNTFKGQITSALESGTGVLDIALQTAKKLSGKSDAVKRKAIKDVIEDALGN